MTNKTKKDSMNGAKRKPLPEVVSCFTYIFDESKMERVSSTSMTVPDEALTIAEILERHTQGITNLHSKQGVFMDTEDYEAEDMEKLSQSDIVEIEDAKQKSERVKKVLEQSKEVKEEPKDEPKDEPKKDEIPE